MLPITGCRNPGSNQGPLDLQSNALPTELFRHINVTRMPRGIQHNEKDVITVIPITIHFGFV